MNYTAHQTMTPLDIARLAKRLAADHFGVSVSDVEGPRRSISPRYARFVAISLIHTHTEYSLNEIGDFFFGGRDHTTILSALRRVEDLRSSAKFAAHYDEIRKRFEGCL